MTENEFLLEDRIAKIKSVMEQYGEANFCMSWSGGKDSCTMSALFDLAIPGNKIPRVFADTGLELSIMRKFVKEQVEKDDRIVIIKPSVNVREMLERDGYPFKSKWHSRMVDLYQRNGLQGKSLAWYLTEKKNVKYKCPDSLRFQFTPDNRLRISDKCCDRMKKKPVTQYKKENGIKYSIIGIMASEGGQRESAKCMAFSDGKLKAFQPLAPMNKKWEDWFIKEYGVEICDIYKPPYNFERTGCKGCPFNPDLQESLDELKEYFPADYKQCEIIWKPVYDEYRRLGYRLRQAELEGQITFDV